VVSLKLAHPVYNLSGVLKFRRVTTGITLFLAIMIIQIRF